LYYYFIITKKPWFWV